MIERRCTGCGKLDIEHPGTDRITYTDASGTAFDTHLVPAAGRVYADGVYYRGCFPKEGA
jgi:hypothetical protein